MSAHESESHEQEGRPRRESTSRQPTMRDRYLHDDDLLEWWERMRRLTKPLIRFLRRQVGKEWATVQSALDARCRALPVDGAVRDQVQTSLHDLVRGRGAVWCRMRGEFFVAPESGLLCYRDRGTKKK